MSSTSTNRVIEGDIVEFLRKRDYRIVKRLGQGACGETVLLHDDTIDEPVVCKKYVPYAEQRRPELFQGFVREIKLLHQLHHKNVVRIFNYYLYSDRYAGYILMEYVRGAEIDDYIARCPERINDYFIQAIQGFAYLESVGILHRDIRTQNLMISDAGSLKIIDLGFGKRAAATDDFKKSITLNWHCSPPAEFQNSIYDFGTEVYFLGKLFQRMIADNDIRDFKYDGLLDRMCRREPYERLSSFATIETAIHSSSFPEIDFTTDELAKYRSFAASISQFIAKIEKGAKYVTDTEKVLSRIAETLRAVGMEEIVPDGHTVMRCLIDGNYYCYKKTSIRVRVLREFVELFNRSTEVRRRIILANLHSKLDAIDRYAPDPFGLDDIPF